MTPCPVCGAALAACGHSRADLKPVDLPIMATKASGGFGGYYLADRRLYTDSEGRVVDEANPNRTTLLAAEGGAIPADEARRLGLLDDEGNRLEPWTDADADPPEARPLAGVVTGVRSADVVTPVAPDPEPPYKADRRLYLDGGGRVVTGTDPARERLLVSANASLPAADARRYGLLDEAGERLEPWKATAAVKGASPTPLPAPDAVGATAPGTPGSILREADPPVGAYTGGDTPQPPKPGFGDRPPTGEEDTGHETRGEKAAPKAAPKRSHKAKD